ncbi:MAG: hypothetical protein K0R58_451 [Ramlibacter sp.]|jgi:hypothetical protein|nr:hypothetical protein [Ramlibacter sp.]
MSRFENAMNRLSDLDAGWWPFLNLRPARDQRMENRWLAGMALRYGLPFGSIVYGWYVFIGFLPLSIAWAVTCVLAAVAFFFVVYRFTFAVAWNRRAERLAAETAEVGAA